MKTTRMAYWFLTAGLLFSPFKSQAQPSGVTAHPPFDGDALLEKLRMDDKQFVAFTNADFAFSHGEVVRIEPSAILVEQGAVGARCLLKDLPANIQQKFGYAAAEAESYEANRLAHLQHTQQAAAQARYELQQARLARLSKAAAAEKLKQKADNKAAIKAAFKSSLLMAYNSFGRDRFGNVWDTITLGNFGDWNRDRAIAQAEAFLPPGAAVLYTKFDFTPDPTPTCAYHGWQCELYYTTSSNIVVTGKPLNLGDIAFGYDWDKDRAMANARSFLPSGAIEDQTRNKSGFWNPPPPGCPFHGWHFQLEYTVKGSVIINGAVVTSDMLDRLKEYKGKPAKVRDQFLDPLVDQLLAAPAPKDKPKNAKGADVVP